MAELEAILEELMLEVAASFPEHRYSHHKDVLKPWAHMTAMFVSEVVKRRHSPRETIIRKARKAVKRRIEKELADSYLGMVLPERPGMLQPNTPVPGPKDGTDAEGPTPDGGADGADDGTQSVREGAWGVPGTDDRTDVAVRKSESV